jgi:hypothetical protein
MVSDLRVNIPAKLDVAAYIATITDFFNSLANGLNFSVGEAVIYYKRTDALHKTVLMIIYYAMIQYATKPSQKPAGYSEFLNWFEAKYMDIRDEDMAEIRGDSDINNNHKILKSLTASNIFDFYNYLISIYKSAKNRDDQLVISTQSYIFYTEMLYLLLADTAANISENSNDATIIADYSEYSGQYRRGFITETNPRFRCNGTDIPVRVKENVIYKLIQDINWSIANIGENNDREYNNNMQVYQSLLSGDTGKEENEITTIESNIAGLRGKLADESKRELLYKARVVDSINMANNQNMPEPGLYKDWPANLSMDHILLVIAFIAAFFAIIYFV